MNSGSHEPTSTLTHMSRVHMNSGSPEPWSHTVTATHHRHTCTWRGEATCMDHDMITQLSTCTKSMTCANIHEVARAILGPPGPGTHVPMKMKRRATNINMHGSNNGLGDVPAHQTSNWRIGRSIELGGRTSNGDQHEWSGGRKRCYCVY